ncbi:GPO family capsid scaffolding protein [Edwardsiella tarda]|uniref:GPO family capsid scaffolding protein n=1 Tax=Edwardsiella tarda TaxID=636 RepID=UPI002444205A|nr:GPO family capsid scaffolding protein [Edwardsiella tarda]WGE29427.1 GPO family capsid scaffolding protein [Edwardsiella tarda]
MGEQAPNQQKITDWVTICRAGPSLDGRKINPQWLRDAAEVYNPQEFTAMMWPFHVTSPMYRWNGTNFGRVSALRTVEIEGVTALQAKLAPNQYAIDANRQRQKIFTSAEFMPNYMNTGKTFLSGLALTDVPASAWTTELKFSQQSPQTIYGQPEEFSLHAQSTEEHTMDSQQYNNLLSAILSTGHRAAALEARLNQFSLQQPQAFAAQQPQAATAFAPQAAFTQAPQAFAAQQPQAATAFAPQAAFTQAPQSFAAQQPQAATAFAPQAAFTQVPQLFAAQQPQAFAAPAQQTAPGQAPGIEQKLFAMVTAIGSSVAALDQKFAQLMQDNTKQPSQVPQGGQQITLI